MKTAIVYDWIDKWGGVERVLLTLHEMFPKAHFFTSYYDERTAPWAKDLKIKTSFIQNLPAFIRKNRILSLPFYPFAFESFDFREYDLVISVSSSFAKGVITRPETLHICYLLTPPRYLWTEPGSYLKGIKRFGRPALRGLREWDYAAAQRPDKIISISQEVASRCKKYYNREGKVVYPPFDERYWSNIKSQLKSRDSRIKNRNYFLIVSRLEPYKKVDLALQCFKTLKYSLVVVGTGSQEESLKRMAGDNVIFLKNLTDKELAVLYKEAEALIMPQREDFGYVALEAQFFGCPIIAYKRGGAGETLIDGKTGVFFDQQTESSLTQAILRYNSKAQEIKKTTQDMGSKQCSQFSRHQFVKRFMLQIPLSKV